MWQPIQVSYAGTWQPIQVIYARMCQSIQVSYARTWKQIHATHHNHRYILKIIHLNMIQALKIPLCPLQILLSMMQHSYIYKYHNEEKTTCITQF